MAGYTLGAPLGDSDVSATVTWPPSGPFQYNMDISEGKAPSRNPATDHVANVVSYYESGNKNIPNYRYDPWHTAGGYFQITDTNWRKYAPQVGVNLGQYPTAMSASGPNGYDIQRAVFDRMYAVEGVAPWANYNPRLAEALGSGRLPAPGWTPSPQSIDSEQARNNTDVRYMTPEEYLSLLPEPKSDEATATKRRNLDDSLANGDNIEQIPSLDVTPRGDNLHIADWDGRNRAQAAIAAGVDEIPVAIRGVPKDQAGQFKLLVGNKKVSLPYTFLEVPKSFTPRSLVSPAQQAQRMVPQAFTLAQAAVAPPTKPDFYPEIVAGINKDIVNPAGIGYRGIGVPDLATNATAGGRIAAANAGSAGQIGLGGAIGSILSSLNPIGSAQAAETGPYKLGAPLEPTSQAPGYNLGTPQPVVPHSYVPDVADVPGVGTAVPPIMNALGSFATSPAASLGALAATQGPGRPFNIGAWRQQYERTLQEMSMPETPWGQFIQKYIIGASGQLLSGIARAGLTEQQANALAPYAELAMSLLPLGAFNPMVAGILSRPGGALANRVMRTPEMRAAPVINRAYQRDVAAGATPAATVSSEMADAAARGIPLTPMDFRKRFGSVENLLGRSLEHSPEASAAMEKFVTQRRNDALVRMDKATEEALGYDSAVELGRTMSHDLNSAREELHDLKDSMRKSPKGLFVEPGEEDPRSRRMAELEKKADDLQSNLDGLRWGQSLFSDSVRKEDIDGFYNNSSPEAQDYLRIGVSDAARLRYRRVPRGHEAYEVMFPKDVEEKVEAAFGNDQARAKDFMHGVATEVRIAESTRDLLRDMGKDAALSEGDYARGLRAARFAVNTASSILLGHHIFSPLYWATRLGESFMDLYHRKAFGSPSQRVAVAQLLSDPGTKIDVSGKGLIAAPTRSPQSQAQVNALAKASFPLVIYPAVAPQSAAEAQ